MRIQLRVLLAAALVAALVGCAVPSQNRPLSRMAFPEAEYRVLPQIGAGTVKGQAFLKTRGGDVKLAAGNEVMLNPVTSYSLEWFEKSYLPGRALEAADPRLATYLRTTVADGSGRFTFRSVPAGEYFVTTIVRWDAATGYQGALQTQGGVVTKRIKVTEGEEIEVILTR